MKKKATKKLSLHRETVAQLEKTELHLAAGGAYTDRCQYSGQGTCGTCEGVCTTNYC